jgi:tetratricopeptide (TPR) repeat protein
LRLVAFGILWFFITLSVESSLIPIPMVIAEYRVYLPSVGFFLAVVAGAMLLVNRIATYGANAMRYALCALLILVFILASATYARNTLWADKVSLWEDVVKKNPNSPRGYNNLGLAYSEKGMYEKAIAAYEYCIAMYPSYRTAYVNLGVAYAVTGRINAAVTIFLKAVAMDPDNTIAYTNLGRAYLESGRSLEAVESYRKAIELNPNNSSAFHGLATAYVRLNLLDDALATYTRLMALSPNHPEAYRNRGTIYATKGDFNQAGEDFRKACSLGDGQSCEFLKDRRFR